MFNPRFPQELDQLGTTLDASQKAERSIFVKLHQTTRVITADQENASMAQSMAAVFPSAASQEMADNLVIRKIPSAMRQTLIMFMQAPSTLRQAKRFIYIYIYICQISVPFHPFSSLFVPFLISGSLFRSFGLAASARALCTKQSAFRLGDAPPWHPTAFLGSFLGGGLRLIVRQ